jgi:hypothetical protein
MTDISLFPRQGRRSLTLHQVRKLIRKDGSPKALPLVHATAVSCGVISYFLGKPWVDRHIIQSDADDFLFPGFTNQPDRSASMRRIWELADMLRNLQFVEGFEEPLSKLETDSVETGFAAFEIGRTLRRAGVRFRFVKPQGVRGEDYDYEAYPNSTDTICIEGKCKLTSTSLTEATIDQTLDKAREQLPKDKPGVIFVRVPEAWAGDDYLSTPFASVVSRFFRRTTRVAMVLVCSRVSIPFDGTKMMSPFVAREFFSERPNFAHAKNWNLAKTSMFESDWPNIFDMVEREQGKLWTKPRLPILVPS